MSLDSCPYFSNCNPDVINAGLIKLINNNGYKVDHEKKKLVPSVQMKRRPTIKLPPPPTPKTAEEKSQAKKQKQRLSSLFETNEKLHILIMNVESFSTTKGCEFAKKFLNSHRTLMAIDESTTIKNPDAKRTKNICELAKLSKYRRILTGSPVTKSPLDLYKQCDFLLEELLGHGSYYTFRTRYAIMKTANFGGRSVQIVVGYRNLGELSEKLKPFSYRVLKDDCLDLPAKHFINRV